MADKMDIDTIEKINVFELQNYLNKYVKITLSNVTAEICGIVYTIDPITENVVILKEDKGALSMAVVMKHAIKAMTIAEDIPEALKNLETADLFSNLTDPTVGLTKHHLVDWLNLSRIPFNDVEDVIEVEGVKIFPPYRAEDCVCNNPTKMLRLQELLKKIPGQSNITVDSGT